MFHHNTADSRPAIKATTDLPDENALLIASGIQIRCRTSHSTLNRLFGSMIPREGGQPTHRGYAPSRRTCQTGGRHTHVNSQPRRRGRRRNETIGRVRPERRRHDPRGGARDGRCHRASYPGHLRRPGDRTSQANRLRRRATSNPRPGDHHATSRMPEEERRRRCGYRASQTPSTVQDADLTVGPALDIPDGLLQSGKVDIYPTVGRSPGDHRWLFCALEPAHRCAEARASIRRSDSH